MKPGRPPKLNLILTKNGGGEPFGQHGQGKPQDGPRAPTARALGRAAEAGYDFDKIREKHRLVGREKNANLLKMESWMKSKFPTGTYPGETLRTLGLAMLPVLGPTREEKVFLGHQVFVTLPERGGLRAGPRPVGAHDPANVSKAEAPRRMPDSRVQGRSPLLPFASSRRKLRITTPAWLDAWAKPGRQHIFHHQAEHVAARHLVSGARGAAGHAAIGACAQARPLPWRSAKTHAEAQARAARCSASRNRPGPALRSDRRPQWSSLVNDDEIGHFRANPALFFFPHCNSSPSPLRLQQQHDCVGPWK